MATTALPAQGKYRPRKEWSTNSIPTLVSLEEETSPHTHNNNAALPPKAPRRSSLAVGLMGGRKGDNGSLLSSGLLSAPPPPEKHNSKRRSSIAVSFLGRHSKVRHSGVHHVRSTPTSVAHHHHRPNTVHLQNRDASYEVAMISEKSDGAINNRSPLQPRSINTPAAATSKWYDADTHEAQPPPTNGRSEPKSAQTSDDERPPHTDSNDSNGQHRNGDSDADDGDADMAQPCGNGDGVLDGSDLSPPQHVDVTGHSPVVASEKVLGP